MGDAPPALFDMLGEGVDVKDLDTTLTVVGSATSSKRGIFALDIPPLHNRDYNEAFCCYQVIMSVIGLALSQHRCGRV